MGCLKSGGFLGKVKLQVRSQWFAWRRHCCSITRAYLRGCMCIFAVSVVCTKQVSWSPVHADVYNPQVFLTSPYTSATQSLQGSSPNTSATQSLQGMRSLFIPVRGRRGGIQLSVWSMQSTCRLAWGVILTEGEIEVLSWVFLILMRVEVYVGVCVCIRTHITHCT